MRFNSHLHLPDPTKSMTPTTRHIPPGPGFWPQVAQYLVDDAETMTANPDLSSALVLVPAWHHAALLRRALADRLGPSFIPPRIRTLASWLSQYPPEAGAQGTASSGERLMSLYASLRELPWLKKLFAARRNTDLMPLAQTLLTICDELTAALLPAALAQPEAVEDRWHAALSQLSPRAAALLSDEARLVWNLWQAERDARDPGIRLHAAMQRAATEAALPLYWCAPAPPNALEASFLNAYSLRQPVHLMILDWSQSISPAIYNAAWPELMDDASQTPASFDAIETPTGISLHEAAGMEDEAQRAAQTIIDWLNGGKRRIALVPQDRVVARRVRALLERAQVVVSDETGWKLSTTRAAAVLHAWLALAASGGEVATLLDFLKSPFLFDDDQHAAEQRAEIEQALLGGGITAGWSLMVTAVASFPQASSLIEAIAREAQRCSGRKTLTEWVDATLGAFDALGMKDGMSAGIAEDVAGAQVIALLDQIRLEGEQLEARFSLAEWRALVDLQMEQTVFVAPRMDQRVMMVPLNGTSLREFDAVIVLGADSDHLPSRPAETLFFANAVRRELGLATRESRQRQQLRELTALLISCPEVVLSWQGWRSGETNTPSPWLQRLELVLDSAGCSKLPRHSPRLPQKMLNAVPAQMPRPTAPALMPDRLSASGYNSLVVCPYQFFASRMLRLSAADELSELPQKRDYGEWLHQILKQYHDIVHEQSVPVQEREACMARVSEAVFTEILQKNPAALGYQSRWGKIMNAYVAWANTHEAEGWQFGFGEQWQERLLSWEGGSVKLVGQIDRIDVGEDGERLVLDYKSAKKDKLNNRLKTLEDHQLPFYGLLLDPPPAAAAYVAIDDEKPALAEADNYATWRDGLQSQIIANWQAMSEGASLPASGTQKNCDWCDARGLCRKGAW
jgi:ATP-dependent helicase/nuclease subunit B